MGIKIFTSIKNYIVSITSQLKQIITKINEHNTSSEAHSSIIPIKTSDLTNDSNFAVDSNYIHTDNNFTNNLKTNLENAPIISSGSGAPSSTPAKVGDIYVDTANYKTYISKGTISSSDWIKQNGSYVLTTLMSAVSSPSDASILYFGHLITNMTNSPTVRRMFIPRNGVISAVYGAFMQTAGSNEASSLYIRVNNTTDYLISNALTHATSATTIANLSLNIPVNVGDYLEFKWITPIWATNPTSLYVGANILIDL